MINDKKILLINDQYFSFLMCMLGKELEKNNEVHYYFINSSFLGVQNSEKKHIDFFLNNKTNNKNIHDVKDIKNIFDKNKKKIQIDYDRLKEIEKNYTNFATINKQLLTSQDTSSHFHDRFYYKQFTDNERLYWLILNYNKTEKLINNVKPDVIFDVEDVHLQRSIINEIAFKKNISYINIEHPRYKNFIIPTFNLGLKQSQFFNEVYQKNKNQKDLKKFIQNILTYRNQNSIVVERNKKAVLSAYQFEFLDLLKEIYIKSKNKFFSLIYNFKDFNLRDLKKLLWHYICSIRKFYLYSKFNKFFTPLINENYVYMPLHLIPESTTFTKAPMYINELYVIESISKILPISWKLLIKEHPAMVGQRSMSFYKQVVKIPNVKLLNFRDYKEPKVIIQNSIAVVTVTGSSAFEAAMFGKPAIVFGNVCFNVIPGIKLANNFEDVEKFFKKIEDGNFKEDSITDCAAYIKSIEEVGVNLNLNKAMILSKKKIEQRSLKDNEEVELKNMIICLTKFFDNALNYCKNF